MQAVKAHFVSVRACTDQSFPKNQWDLLPPHAGFTLNLLRPSKINKNISAHTIMHGHYDFMKHPISMLEQRHWHMTGQWIEVPGMTEGLTGSSSTKHQNTTETTSATCQSLMQSELPAQLNSFQTAPTHPHQAHLRQCQSCCHT